MSGNKKAIKAENIEIKQEKLSNKSLILVLILTLGIVALILLYLNFKFTLSEHKNYPVTLEPPILKEVAKQDVMEEKKPQPAPTIEQKPDLVKENKASCKDFVELLQDYYQMKLEAEKGKDFTNELMELNQYVIQSTEIIKHLSALANLSSNNKREEYFGIKFNSLIRDIYNIEKHQVDVWSLGYYIRKLIFIRPTGERAIDKGGLDMDIALTEKLLVENNLAAASNQITKLPNHLESLKELQLELENKLAIKEHIFHLDKLFSSKIDCNIVSK